MKAARTFIQSAGKKVIILPDRDADGLCGGSILYHTLRLIGHQNVAVHFMKKGQNVHHPGVAEEIQSKKPSDVFVIDQGSRPSKLGFGVPTLVIDHHSSNLFPEDATILSGFKDPLGPDAIPPSSLLTYLCCKELHSDVESKYDWLALIGTHGDLGTSFSWPSPYPASLKSAISKYGRENISTAVSLINAPRRTTTADPSPAWKVLLSSSSPKEVIDKTREDSQFLWKCREEVNAEVARCSRIPPRFSSDGTKALVHFASGAQVHPVVAVRWAGHLKEANLQMVIAANDGYLPGKVNFAARVANVAKKKGEEVNLIEKLKEAVQDDVELQGVLGDDYARGHAQATGGIVPKEIFGKLLDKLGFVPCPKKKVSKTKTEKTAEKNDEKNKENQENRRKR